MQSRRETPTLRDRQRRCSHPEAVIAEEARGWAQHWLEAGEVRHNLVEPDFTGSIAVRCYACGLQRTYTPSRIPKWVSQRRDILVSFSDGEKLPKELAHGR